MLILTMALALVGLVGWFWIWVRSHYQTGSSCRIQFGVITIGFAWLLMLVGDIPHIDTTFATRAALIIALWCLQPLLLRGK